ncbi:MBL fold metallo-hydrolase [Streptococcus gallolyticus]|uniref:MBL fold metallo-hydrolase n=1 Tax=Streptococcus gallolyticus TaxID=315405 RepID=UPI00088134B9|nr:MBL fold metallo-hydrolase [Streptococcus gallolyticus]SDJ91350.1 Glyoxylase, beta-lactamase superfamily II [Streptococcus gallolyticus]SDL41091.1 Glyoxylase, beta-lactamase superfamily II [Streptococcus gallolyticus]
MTNYYQVEKVNQHILAIKSLGGEFVYLILGKKRALLIDTCVGIGHLRQIVESLTDLPITVALSHGHVDHAMGAPEFEDVYLNPLDLPIYQKMCDVETRLDYLKITLPCPLEESMKETLLEAKPNYDFKPLEDGQVFDLGDLHVTAYAFPGHTPGMMAFLIAEEEILILGDACNNSTFLFDEDACDVETYQNALKSVREHLDGKFKRIFISHHDMEVSVDILDNMLGVCDDIINGKSDDLPFHFMGMQAYIAKACDEHFCRKDGKDGNLIYNKKKIYARKEKIS